MGQPSLDEPRRAYLVSGQGDGAMIDLLRLRISQFRQDRILDELFSGKTDVLEAIKGLYQRYSTDVQKSGLFNALEDMANQATHGAQVSQIREDLSRRLR